MSYGAGMRLRVLGAVALEPIAGAEGAGALAPRLRRLLAALAVHRNAVVSVDSLAEVVWGDQQPSSPEAALHNLVSRLRTAMRTTGPAATVVTRPPGYLLRVDAADMDAACFELLSGRGRAELAGDPFSAAESLQEALALWRGAAYAEFADEDFARPEAVRLEALRATTVEGLAEALLASGRPADAVPRLERLLADEPLRERARGLLMLAHYRSGEQAEALNDFTVHRERLADELGVDPSPALQRLQQQVLRQDPALDPGPVRRPRPVQRPTGNLPANPPELVGRDADLAHLVEAVRPGSVVTLTGPGGVGKTSLALSSSSALATRFPDGSWFCDLSSLSGTDDLPLAVSSVLDLPTSSGGDPARHLMEFLSTRRLLLVLDNCEHVFDAAAALAYEVHRRARDVAVLCTSRAPLDVPGEEVRPVSPLSAADAERLFVDRTRRRLRAFELESNAASVAEICRRLDGVPLAIELAAARMGAMTPADLVDRLSWRFTVLRGGARAGAERHRTLGALVDWSYELLDDAHQQVFEVLSLFVGGFGLDDAERLVLAVRGLDSIGDEAQVADVVLGLVDRSMVAVSATGQRARYVLLETLRAYGRQRLETRPYLHAAHRAHAEQVADRIAGAAGRLYGPGHVEASAAITRQLDELRAAHSWALANDLGLATRLVGPLALYVEHRMPVEVPQWADRTLHAAEGSPPPEGLASVYAVAAAGARFAGDLQRAARLAEAGLGLPSDPMTGGYLRMLLAETALFEGRLADVERHRTEVAALAVEADLGAVGLLNDLLAPLVAAYGGDSEGAARQAEALQRSAARRGAAPIEAWARYLRGEALLDSDPEAATELLDGAVSLAREQGDRYSGGVALVSAASVRGRHGDPRSAVPLFAEVIEHWRTVGDWTHQWTSLRGVVDVLVRLGREQDAAVLRGALLERTSAPPVFGADAERMAATGALLSQRLGEDVARELGQRGARMTDDEVVVFTRRALDEVRGPVQRSR